MKKQLILSYFCFSAWCNEGFKNVGLTNRGNGHKSFRWGTFVSKTELDFPKGMLDWSFWLIYAHFIGVKDDENETFEVPPSFDEEEQPDHNSDEGEELDFEEWT